MTEAMPDDPFVVLDVRDTHGRVWSLMYDVDQLEHTVKQLRHRERIMQAGDTCCLSGGAERVVLADKLEVLRVVRELERIYDERKL